MLRKLLLISLLLGSSFGAFASIDQRSQDEVINAIYDHLQNNGYLEGISSDEKSTVIDIIKTEVENSFGRVKAGELSLDTAAPNYFLFDTIGNIIKSVVKTVKKIGGKIFNAIKGVLGTVVDVGLKFLSKIDNDFIKSVIGVGADALGVLIAGSGEALAAASLLIPVAGEVIAPVVATLAPFATMVINSDTVGLAADAIAGASKKVLEIKDKDVEKGFAAAALAPNPDASLDSMSKKKKSKSQKKSSAHDKHKTDFTKHFSKTCHGLMKYLSKLNADQYNNLPEKVKKSAAYCNHYVGAVNATVEK